MSARDTVTAGRNGGPRICVLTFPMRASSPGTLVLNLIQLLYPLCDRLWLVGGNLSPETHQKASEFCIVLPAVGNPWIRNNGDKQLLMPWDGRISILDYIRAQTTLFVQSVKLVRHIDGVIVFIGAPHLVLQMAVFRVCGRKVIWY